MCGAMGKAVLRALTGALLCSGLVSDAAYLQSGWPPQRHSYYGLHVKHDVKPDFVLVMDKNTPAVQWILGAMNQQTNFATPYTPFAKPYTPFAKPYTPFAKPYTSFPKPYTPFGKPYTSFPKPYTHFLREFLGQPTRTSYRYEEPNYPSHYGHYENQAILKKPLREHEKPQDLRNVPGIPGVDYPIYHEVPETHFSCAHVPVHPGMYANVETGCQAYHVCHDGREGHQGASFLCTNGTLFHQEKFACDWWYNVDCSQAVEHYKLNADPLKNPYTPKPKPEELAQHHDAHEHGIFYRL